MTHSSPRTCGKSRRQISQAIESVKVEHGATGIIHRKLRRENRRGLALLPVNNSERPIRGGIFIGVKRQSSLFFLFFRRRGAVSIPGVERGGALTTGPIRSLQKPRRRKNKKNNMWVFVAIKRPSLT